MAHYCGLQNHTVGINCKVYNPRFQKYCNHLRFQKYCKH